MAEMNFYKKIALFLFLLAGVAGWSQTYNIKNYNTDQGLPQSQVLSIFQDHNGYMWFGTNSGGVGKFDGRTFTSLTKNKGLIDDNVYSITENDKNELFFGTSKGLSVYNNFSFKNYDEKNGLKNAWVFKLLNDGSKIWIGTQGGVYLYEDGKISPFEKDSVLSNSSVWSVFMDRDKNLWFATQQNGVIYFNKKTNTFKHFTSKNGLMNDQIFSVSQREDGTVLVGTLTGLNEINSSFNVSEANEISTNRNICYWSVLKDKKNEFYYGTYAEGLLNFNFKTNVRRFFNASNGLTNNIILSLLKDREGNLWIGTTNGVYKYYNDKFVYYIKENGLLDNYINKVGEDSYGNYWLAIPNNGVARITGTVITNYKPDFKRSNSLLDKNVNAILPVENGKIYFGTESGLSVFESETFTTLTSDVFKKKYIQCLFRDSKNKIWIGTAEGVYSLENGGLKEEKIINAFKQADMEFAVFCIIEDKNSNLFFGLENGMLKYDGKKIIHIDDKNNFVRSRVCCGVKDSHNNIWFGTGEGLFLYDNSTFKKVTKRDAGSFGFINFLQLDKRDRLLIGTNNGVDILDLNGYYQNRISIKHLGKEDGLLSRESNFNASVMDKNGKILIGTASGLNIYDPASDVLNTNEAKTHITGIQLFFGQEDISKYSNGLDSVSLLPENLVLPYSKNNLTFQFIGLSLIAPEKVMYKYMLEGLDHDWSPAVNATQASYPALPPGTYTFMIKAMNNDGLWNSSPSKFSFEVLSPWYKTWWFYLICSACLLAGILYYNYSRTKKLVEDKQKLEKEVSERTKELREEKEKVEIINKEVIEQKTEIEHKNEEITDSIKYAKNIQEALLPSLKATENAFENCFILYEPKDIVSGDFFWFFQNESTRYIAAADCTGHGVPGAFMSIVGNTLLNEVVLDNSCTKPGDMLLQLHKGVKVALNQNDSESQRRDGMDIALCSIPVNATTMEYSGANRPLWIYRKNKNYELEIIKPTKSPIGGLELEESRVYETVTLDIFKGDVLYFFSDGFADQFGGPKGKKFMISNMQRLLFENIELPMATQKQHIKQAFDQWKGDTEQVDDVLVIGIRI